MIHNEAGVKAAVKRMLKDHGWFGWMPPANGYGRVGISDIHALKGGHFVAIETKYGGNKPTAMQAAFLGNIAQAGGTALVVNERNLDELEAFLSRHELREV